MRRTLILIGVCLVAFCVIGGIWAKEKKPKAGPLTGTWECMSHGGSRGDLAFTLYLEQNKENVTGSVSSPQGGMDITTGTFRRSTLEIHFDTPQGDYVLMGKLKRGQFTGQWSGGQEQEKGSWEGKKKSGAKP